MFITPDVRVLDEEISNLVLEYQGGRQFREQLFVPTPENVEAQLGKAAALQAQVAESSLHRLWKTHFDSILRGFRLALREDTLLAYVYAHRLSAAVQGMLDDEHLDDQERWRFLARKLASLEALLDAALLWLRDLPPLRRRQAEQAAHTLQAVLAKVPPEKSSHWHEWLEKHLAALAELPEAKEEREGLSFEEVLRDGMQVPLDFVLSWYEQALEERTAEFYELGRRLDPSRSPFAIIKQDSRQYDTAQAMFADARRIMDISRENALKLVTLPEGEHCSVGPVPEYNKVDCPNAMYAGPDLWSGELRGMMGLNPDNLPSFTRAGLWSTVAHEVYPGHHTNYVKSATAQLPHTFKLSQSLTRCLVEGIATRSSWIMAPYYENDLARLAAARGAMQSAARVRGEIDINYYGRSPEEIKRMYQEDMDATEVTARLSVECHLMYPGDCISYYTGARVMEALREELEMEQGEFTDIIFSFGFVSLDTMEQIVRLMPEERQQLRDFYG